MDDRQLDCRALMTETKPSSYIAPFLQPYAFSSLDAKSPASPCCPKYGQYTVADLIAHQMHDPVVAAFNLTGQ